MKRVKNGFNGIKNTLLEIQSFPNKKHSINVKNNSNGVPKK